MRDRHYEVSNDYVIFDRLLIRYQYDINVIITQASYSSFLQGAKMSSPIKEVLVVGCGAVGAICALLDPSYCCAIVCLHSLVDSEFI